MKMLFTAPVEVLPIIALVIASLFMFPMLSPRRIVIIVHDSLFDRPFISHTHSWSHAKAYARHPPAAHAHPHPRMAKASMQQGLHAFKRQGPSGYSCRSL